MKSRVTKIDMYYLPINLKKKTVFINFNCENSIFLMGGIWKTDRFPSGFYSRKHVLSNIVKYFNRVYLIVGFCFDCI